MKTALNAGRHLFGRAGGGRELLNSEEADFQVQSRTDPVLCTAGNRTRS